MKKFLKILVKFIISIDVIVLLSWVILSLGFGYPVEIKMQDLIPAFQEFAKHYFSKQSLIAFLKAMVALFALVGFVLLLLKLEEILPKKIKRALSWIVGLIITYLAIRILW